MKGRVSPLMVSSGHLRLCQKEAVGAPRTHHPKGEHRSTRPHHLDRSEPFTDLGFIKGNWPQCPPSELGEHFDTVEIDGVLHTLERVSDPDRVAAIRECVSSSDVLIADGHHRYGWRASTDSTSLPIILNWLLPHRPPWCSSTR